MFRDWPVTCLHGDYSCLAMNNTYTRFINIHCYASFPTKHHTSWLFAYCEVKQTWPRRLAKGLNHYRNSLSRQHKFVNFDQLSQKMGPKSRNLFTSIHCIDAFTVSYCIHRIHSIRLWASENCQIEKMHPSSVCPTWKAPTWTSYRVKVKLLNYQGQKHDILLMPVMLAMFSRSPVFWKSIELERPEMSWIFLLRLRYSGLQDWSYFHLSHLHHGLRPLGAEGRSDSHWKKESCRSRDQKRHQTVPIISK